jgi:hypothetical protein
MAIASSEGTHSTSSIYAILLTSGQSEMLRDRACELLKTCKFEHAASFHSKGTTLLVVRQAAPLENIFAQARAVFTSDDFIKFIILETSASDFS